MEIVLYSYTIAIMFLYVIASATAISSYVITNNRLYAYVAAAFFLYFIDLAIIFGTEYLHASVAIGSDEFYAVENPLMKSVLSAGVLELLWVIVCTYLNRINTLRIALPPVLFLLADFLIVNIMPAGPLMQWSFYTTREVFLAWCIGYVFWCYLTAKAPSVKAHIRKQLPALMLGAVLCVCIVIENTFIILLYHPVAGQVDSIVLLYLSERNISENVLMIAYAVLTLRHNVNVFMLRQKDPVILENDDKQQARSIDIDRYCDKFKLTNRERSVLCCILAGKDYQNTASELQLAVGTVKSHTHNILKKTNTATRQELVQNFWEN